MPPVGMAGPYGSRVAQRSRGRALPIAVASGLALGVFAGLFVVRANAPDEESSTDRSGAAAALPPPGGPAAPLAPPSPPGPDGKGQPDPASSPGEPASAPSSEAPSGAAPAAQPSVAVVSFAVRPRRAHIFVDGTELDGPSTDVPLSGGSAEIQVVIKSHGHRSHRETYTVTGDQTIEVALRKREEPDGPGSQLDIR